MPPTVLVADADRDCANAVAMLLNGAGISAQVAYGGRAAITLSDEYEPACAVIDIAMPGISGLDVARHLRTRYRRDVHIVGYTSWTGAEDRQRAAQAGFDEVVAKDADPFELLAALSTTTHAVVMRSLAASRRQLRLQLDLATALLNQAWLMPDANLAEKSFSIVLRTLSAVDSTIARLPLEHAERAALTLAVAGLRERLPTLPSE
jgi:CheY-like chemotaxis protein